MTLAGGPPQVQLGTFCPLHAAQVVPTQTSPPEHTEPGQQGWLKPPQAAQVPPEQTAPLPQPLEQQG